MPSRPVAVLEGINSEFSFFLLYLVPAPDYYSCKYIQVQGGSSKFYVGVLRVTLSAFGGLVGLFSSS